MNWKSLRKVAVIAWTVLIGCSACTVSRVATSASVKAEVRGLTAEVRDSVRTEQVMVAASDSITETTTITIRENEQGDTIRMSKVTERARVRSMSDVRSKTEEVRVVRDTVYVERRDSVQVSEFQGSRDSSKASPVVSALRWIFWILVCVIVLVLMFKVKGLFNFFK